MPETPAVPCIPRVAPGSGAETRAVRTGIATDGQHGAVIPPIYLSSTYAFAGFKDKRTYDYTRTANPTRDVLGLALAELEEGAGNVKSGETRARSICIEHVGGKPGDVYVGARHVLFGERVGPARRAWLGARSGGEHEGRECGAGE